MRGKSYVAEICKSIRPLPHNSPSLPCQQFKLFWSSRPVLAQQSRQRPIRKQLSSRLAIWAVIGFIGCVSYALNLRLTPQARLFVSAVHRHFRTKRRNFFRKLAARLLPQPLGPPRQIVAHCRIQALNLLRLELLRQCERRELRFKKNLIGIGIADAAE